MGVLRLLAGVAGAALLCGCSDPRKEAVAKITPAEAKELRIAASRLYLEARPRRAPEYVPAKPTAWPAPFQKYKPLRVGVYPDGVVLALQGDAGNEQGLHILPIAMELAPARGHVTYDKIQDGVYWYRLGK
jgi:hypothetical protein